CEIIYFLRWIYSTSLHQNHSRHLPSLAPTSFIDGHQARQPIAPPADERRDEEGFNGTTGGNVNLNLDEVHHDAAAPDHDGFPDIQPIVFGGSGRPQPCEGCRVHRKRCDLTRPSCSRCIKRQVPCSYKPAPIK
ncbi:hypothetical protein BCR33DRAFT_761646, partial [Rhizoclosmatium globosum]